MAELNDKAYLKLLKERRKQGRVTTPHQLVGLTLAQILGDDKHKALYIKFAKENDHDFLIGLAKDIAERKGIKNRGAYFMKVFHEKRTQVKTKTGTTRILITNNKSDEKFLRTKVPPIDLAKENIEELRKLVKRMRTEMVKVSGIGLSANQIGVNKRIFVAQVPNEQGEAKFYAVINPKIIKMRSEKVEFEEGCLSVPEIYGMVERWNNIVLKGYTLEGKKLKIKAWGLLARVFQHEVDHLNGALFTDRCKKTHPE